jgi:hypothetical protein
MPRRPQKVLVLRRSRSLTRRSQFAMYYVGYGLCAIAGGLVLTFVAFLLFLFLCNCLGVTDPAGNSDALLVLLAFEIGVLSVYGVLVLRTVKSRINKVAFHLPSYRRDPAACR